MAVVEAKTGFIEVVQDAGHVYVTADSRQVHTGEVAAVKLSPIQALLLAEAVLDCAQAARDARRAHERLDG